MSLLIQERATSLGVVGPGVTANLRLVFQSVSFATLGQQGPPGAAGDDGLPGPPGDIGGDPGNLILYFENGLT